MRDAVLVSRKRSRGAAVARLAALQASAPGTFFRIAVGEAEMDGSAARSPRTLVAALPRSRPEPLRQAWRSQSRHASPVTAGVGRARPRMVARRRHSDCQRSTTSRDGVAHEAPLSPVWRGHRFPIRACAPHAAARSQLDVDAAMAREPTSPSPK
jgi:hypothetical protein